MRGLKMCTFTPGSRRLTLKFSLSSLGTNCRFFVLFCYVLLGVVFSTTPRKGLFLCSIEYLWRQFPSVGGAASSLPGNSSAPKLDDHFLKFCWIIILPFHNNFPMVFGWISVQNLRKWVKCFSSFKESPILYIVKSGSVFIFESNILFKCFYTCVSILLKPKCLNLVS